MCPSKLYTIVKKNTTHTIEYLSYAFVKVSLSRLDNFALSALSEVANKGSSTELLQIATIKIMSLSNLYYDLTDGK